MRAALRTLSRRILLPVTLAAVVVYLAVGGLLYAGQDDLIFHPDVWGREPAVTPGNHGWQYEDVWLEPPGAGRVHGWFVPHPASRGVVLLCHGNAGNIGHRLDFTAMLRELGLSVLLFDYRGFGRSEGRPAEQRMYQDAEAALAHLVQDRGYASERVIVLGRSLGGAVASYLGGTRSVRALILESSFTSLVDMASQLYPLYPVRWMSRYRFDTRRHLERNNAPVMILHSRDDERVPFTHGQLLFAAAGTPKRFVTLNGSHNDTYATSADQYKQALGRFLAEY